MIELQNYTMHIWVKDRRTKTGERLCSTYVYQNKHDQWMKEEVRDLQSGLYPANKFRIEVTPTFCKVKSLMTGEEVTIRVEDRGGVCDPSTEQFWSV